MTEVTGFISLGILIICNIAMVAFGYGRLTQMVKGQNDKIDTIDDRVTKIENNPQPVCPFHTEAMEKISALDAKQEVVMNKLDL